MPDEQSDAAESGPDREEPETRKQPKIFTEEAKAPQTTHWDMDYLPREAIEEAYANRDDADTADED